MLQGNSILKKNLTLMNLKKWVRMTASVALIINNT